MSLINGLHGTVAVLLLGALLFIDEAGVPMPWAPNEVLLIVAGLLLANETLNPWVFFPVAGACMTAGMIAAYGWARAIGSDRLRAIAVRLHAQRTYDRAAQRVRHAGPLGLGIARVIPGIRVYATLIAGAAEVDLRIFLLGAMPALTLWLVVITAVGAAVGLPAEHFLSDLSRLAISGAVLLVAAGGAYWAVRRIPHSARAEVLTRAPTLERLVLAAALDIGIVATIIAGLDRITRSIAQTPRPNGIPDLIVLVSAVAVAYVAVTRRGPGNTAGERIFDVSYRSFGGHSEPAHREAESPRG